MTTAEAAGEGEEGVRRGGVRRRQGGHTPRMGEAGAWVGARAPFWRRFASLHELTRPPIVQPPPVFEIIHRIRIQPSRGP